MNIGSGNTWHSEFADPMITSLVGRIRSIGTVERRMLQDVAAVRGLVSRHVLK